MSIHCQAAFKRIRFVDASELRLPLHQATVQEDKTRQSNTLGFSVKVLAICYATSFDEVSEALGNREGEGGKNEMFFKSNCVAGHTQSSP
jgi:hypothetical protein